MSGFPWRATVAAVLLVEIFAALPRFDRASRRASTRARLWLCWAVRLGVEERPPGRLAREAVRSAPPGRRLGATLGPRSWHWHLCSLAGLWVWAFAAAKAVALISSLRVRSRELSARLPPRESASRRAKTSCLLGLAMGLGIERRAEELVWPAVSLGSGALGFPKELLGEFRRAVELPAGALGKAALVRVGRASAAPRTRVGPEEYRPADFLPPLVRALRRSRAASRLDGLAISVRKVIVANSGVKN